RRRSRVSAADTSRSGPHLRGRRTNAPAVAGRAAGATPTAPPGVSHPFFPPRGVMAGLDPAIHANTDGAERGAASEAPSQAPPVFAWMPGSSPGHDAAEA